MLPRRSAVWRTRLQYECKQPVTLYKMANPINKALTGVKWFLSQSGLAASSHLEAGAFINSNDDLIYDINKALDSV